LDGPGHGQAREPVAQNRPAHLGGPQAATSSLAHLQAIQGSAFAEKVEDIVGLYMHPPAHAVVLSIDEKSQIQALDRT